MRLVQFGLYRSPTEASLIQARLEANGIQASVQEDTGSGMIPVLAATAGVKVMVMEEDLADAYEVLERMLPSGD